jgi:hypothetical protein
MGVMTSSTQQQQQAPRTSSMITTTTTTSSENTTTLEDCIEKLWRKTQIQKSVQATHSHHPKKMAKDDTNNSTKIHVAICAVIVSTLPHEDIWRSWLQKHQSPNTSASIHIHAKTPSAIRNDSWLKSKLIPISHDPNWNDIKVVQAMLSLIEFALKTKETTHIMFVTESCIPIAPLDSLASLLRRYGTGEDNCCSFMDYYSRESPRCTRFDEHACFHIEGLPTLAIYKALPGWCLLSKKHAEQVLNLPEQLGGKELYPLFKSVWAPEEVFFPTALSLVGILPGNEVVQRSIMWAKWDERAKGSQRAHPIVYDGDFGENLVTRARNEGFMFMRKFKQKLNVLDWERIIFSTSNNNKREGVDSDACIDTKRLKR